MDPEAGFLIQYLYREKSLRKQYGFKRCRDPANDIMDFRVLSGQIHPDGNAGAQPKDRRQNSIDTQDKIRMPIHDDLRQQKPASDQPRQEPPYVLRINSDDKTANAQRQRNIHRDTKLIGYGYIAFTDQIPVQSQHCRREEKGYRQNNFLSICTDPLSTARAPEHK